MCGCEERKILRIVITITIFSQSIRPLYRRILLLWCRNNSFRTPQTKTQPHSQRMSSNDDHKESLSPTLKATTITAGSFSSRALMKACIKDPKTKKLTETEDFEHALPLLNRLEARYLSDTDRQKGVAWSQFFNFTDQASESGMDLVTRFDGIVRQLRSTGRDLCISPSPGADDECPSTKESMASLPAGEPCQLRKPRHWYCPDHDCIYRVHVHIRLHNCQRTKRQAHKAALESVIDSVTLSWG
jgi:hypothetical protein